MSSRINEIELSSDSNDFNHPNIDKKSFMAFKRQQKELAKEEKRKKLNEINCILEKYDANVHNDKNGIKYGEEKIKSKENDNKTQVKTNDITKVNNIEKHYNDTSIEDLRKEKEKLEFELSEKIYETESNTCIYNQEIQENEEDQVQLIIQLLNDNSLDNFITLIENAKINLDALQDLVLYNLSEQIKEGNDDIGIELTRLGIYVKYGIESGKSFVYKMKDALNDERKKELFEKEVKAQFEASKEAILEMQNEK